MCLSLSLPIAFRPAHIYNYKSLLLYIYILIYTSPCFCLCVCRGTCYNGYMYPANEKSWCTQ